MSDYTIVQGDTGPILEVFAEIMTSTSGWTCAMSLRAPSGEVVLTRQVTDTNQEATKFVAYVTDIETASLDVNVYSWEISLHNTILNPDFSARELHTVCIEPDVATRTSLELVRGENSFCDYPMLIEHLAQLPGLYGINSVSRVKLKAAAVEAWFDIGALCVDFGNGLSTTRYLDSTALDLLTSQEQQLLIRAQLAQANYILTIHPSERDATVREITAGESTTVFRNNRRVIVCARAMEILRPFLTPGQAHTARISV